MKKIRVHRNTVSCFSNYKNGNSIFQVETAFPLGISLPKCPLKHILNSEETIYSRNFAGLLRLSYTYTCTEERGEERKDNCLYQENQPFSPVVSCLWICTALEKCTNHFYTGNCLRKLEILVQRNQSAERMPTCYCYELLYIHKGNLQRTPVLQLLMYIVSIVGLHLLQALVTLSITNNIITMLKILIQNSFKMIFLKNIPHFKIELFNPGFPSECFSFKKGFSRKY